ncbi:MAG: 4-(cytidine 5'-diphospho)-2-C-methyl-D-erythritol kinase [Blastocatellia bacterium]
MILTLPSFAKINWTLDILGRRADGYHELRTLLQTVSLADELTFEPVRQGIEIVCDHPDVPCDETNLVHRAARLLRQFTGIEKGVRIRIEKRLPVAAGIGGGSSNAAATLIALQRLWNVRLAPRDLFSLGAKLGADVPFFFLGGTALGVGRGDEVYPVADIRVDHLLLVNAGIQVSTKEVYGNLPPDLTNPGGVIKMPLSSEAAYAALAQPDELPVLHNDLENTVFARHPLLAEIKRRLGQAGARGVLMSGSGSTVFAIFDSEETRSMARRDLDETGWWCEPARTLSRTEYRQLMAGQQA